VPLPAARMIRAMLIVGNTLCNLLTVVLP